MKKMAICMMMAVLSLSFVPNPLKATPKTDAVSMTVTNNAGAEKAMALRARIMEIKKMDKSNLTAPQKKELKKEVRDIQRQLADISGGVYISAGLLIVILILLIILT